MTRTREILRPRRSALCVAAPTSFTATHSRRHAGPRWRGQDEDVTKKSHTETSFYFPVESRTKTSSVTLLSLNVRQVFNMFHTFLSGYTIIVWNNGARRSGKKIGIGGS